MTAPLLQTTYDSGLQVIGVNGATQGISKAVQGATAQDYCISAQVSNHWAYVKGPGGQVVNGDTQNPAVTSEPC
jgi:hypothetical protein